MSNNQTSTNQPTDTHPWKDWKVDPGFFFEISKYLASKDMTFVDAVERLIDKAKAGSDLNNLNEIIPDSPALLNNVISGVVVILKAVKHYPEAQSEAFELLKSFANWIEDWRIVFKGRPYQISEKVQDGLSEKREFMVEVFKWAFDSVVARRPPARVKEEIKEYNMQFNTLLECRWNEWDVDQVFLAEMNDYLKKKKKTFTDIVTGAVTIAESLEGMVLDSPAPVKTVFSGIIIFLKLIQKYSMGKEKILELLKSMANWIEITRKHFDDGKGEFLEKTWEDLKVKRHLVDQIFEWAYDRVHAPWTKKVKWQLQVENDIKGFHSKLDAIHVDFMEQAVFHNVKAVDKLIAITEATDTGVQSINKAVFEQVVPFIKFSQDDIMLKNIKEKLGYDYHQFFREGREFTEGTRIEVMAKMDDWASQITQGPSTMLITGLPGSGKSTLADMWTHSEEHKESFIFGARICFNRQRDVTAKAVFSSIAVQLLEKTSSKQALEAVHSKVIGSGVQIWSLMQHVENIFTLPVNIITEQIQSRTLVIVIDALDECSDKQVFVTVPPGPFDESY